VPATHHQWGTRAFRKLLALYPQADKPPVTILISRGKPLAISGPGDGVQIALEAICAESAAKFLQPDLDDRLVHVTAHEYIHAQQSPALANAEHPTVLERSLVDPTAEVVPAGRFYRVVTKDGATVTGRLLNIDTYTVQMIDTKEQLRSFTKANLKESGFIASPMPSYKSTFNAQELADVVSYLVSLKGRATP